MARAGYRGSGELTDRQVLWLEGGSLGNLGEGNEMQHLPLPH